MYMGDSHGDIVVIYEKIIHIYILLIMGIIMYIYISYVPMIIPYHRLRLFYRNCLEGLRRRAHGNLPIVGALMVDHTILTWEI